MDYQLLYLLACPNCKGKLVYDKARLELVCQKDQLAFPIIDDIPVMLVEKARHLAE